MRVCDRCLAAIMSHEGKCRYTTIDLQFELDSWDDFENPEDNPETTCEWCEDSGFCVLYEI